MKYENKDVQIISTKIVESVFTNIYEILNVEKANVRTDITHTVSLTNNNIIELTVGLKLIDRMQENEKEETILSISSLTKVHVSDSKLKMNSETDFDLDKDVTRQIVAFAFNNLTIKTRIILDMYGFGTIKIPFLADARDLDI